LCTVTKARVQNFELPLIIRKWFNNNRFFQFTVFSVKNYEQYPVFGSPPAAVKAAEGGSGNYFNYLKFKKKLNISVNFTK